MKCIAIVSLVALASGGCAGVDKLDFGRALSRDGWQRPDRVVSALGIDPGDHVVDLGSGGGYFLPFLAQAVGPRGRVYAVDVDPNVVVDLTGIVESEGLENVLVVLADYDDPRLPDDSVDLVLIVNAYHHIEERHAYLEQLHSDLRRDGRIAVIEPDEELGGVLGLFVKDDHATERGALQTEMAAAGYTRSAGFDFLPVQIFEVFAVEPGGETTAHAER